MKNWQNTGILHDIYPKINKILEFFMILARKMPEFYMKLIRKINKFMNFTWYLPEIFFSGIFGATVPLTPPPISYAYGTNNHVRIESDI